YAAHSTPEIYTLSLHDALPISKSKFKSIIGPLVCAGAFLNAPISNASVFYHIDVNTASLMGNPGAPFSLDFQLNDGSGVGDGNRSEEHTSELQSQSNVVCRLLL